MLVRILLALVLCFSFGLQQADARDTWRLKPGVKVQLKSKTSGSLALRRPGLGVSGSFDCSCWGASGTCTLSQSGSTLICYKGGSDTCGGSCRLSTTIPSAVRGVLLRR